jgi:hypothetical protein
MGFLSPKVNPRKIQMDILSQDARMMQNNIGGAGLTEAQKQQQVTAATQQANAQAQTQVQQMGRMALGGQNFHQAALVDAARASSEQVALAGAQARSNAEQQSLDKIQMFKDNTLAALDAEREKRKQNRQFWMQFGLDSVATIGNIITGLMK